VIFKGYLDVLKSSFISLIPIIIIFMIYQMFLSKEIFKKKLNYMIGIIISFIGLTLFIQGTNIGYTKMGEAIGSYLGKSEVKFILIPLGFIFGFCITLAEPAIKVLVNKIEEATNGYIKKKIMIITLCIGVAISTSLAMIKVLYNIPLLVFLIPIIIIILILTNFVSQEFTGIAFDSGGVGAGTMAVAFLLPMAIGVCEANDLTLLDGFGIVGLISLTPILSVLVLGVIYKIIQNFSRRNRNDF